MIFGCATPNAVLRSTKSKIDLESESKGGASKRRAFELREALLSSEGEPMAHSEEKSVDF